MIWKKNALSYGLWAVYLSAAAFVFLRTGVEAAVRKGLENRLAAYGAAGLMLLIVILVFIGCRRISGWKHSGELISPKWRQPACFLLLAALLGAGLLLRAACIQYAGEAAAYFDTARVVEGGTVPQVIHGATYFYLQLLHGLFYLAGNHWMAGIWLQLVLQAAAVALLYFSVRKLAGELAALLMAAFYMLDPVMILEGLTYSPKLLYLCFYACGLLCVTGFLDRRAKGKLQSVYDVLLLVFCGLAAAFVCYLDLTGVTLLLLGSSILWLKRPREKNRWGNVLLEWAVFLGSSVGCFFGILALDALASSKPFGGVLRAWLSLYLVKGYGGEFWMQAGGDYITVLLVTGMMLLGAAAFWLKRHAEKFSPWILVLAIVCIMDYCHVSAAGMEGAGFLYLFSVILAGIGVSESLARVPALERMASPVTVPGLKTSREGGLTVLDLEKDGLETDGLEAIHRTEEQEDFVTDSKAFDTEPESEVSGKAAEGRTMESQAPDTEPEIHEPEGEASGKAAEGRTMERQTHDTEPEIHELESEVPGKAAEGRITESQAPDTEPQDRIMESNDLETGNIASAEELLSMAPGTVSITGEEQGTNMHRKHSLGKHSSGEHSPGEHHRHHSGKKHHSGSLFGAHKRKKKRKSGTMPEDSGYGAHVMSVEDTVLVSSEKEKKDAPPQVKNTPSAVKLIDNPLPLPKKHVKRVMGYGFEPDEKDMAYDYQVADDDDFDIR